MSIFLFVFPFFRVKSARWLDSRLGEPHVPLGVRRRGRLALADFQAISYVFLKGLKFVDLLIFMSTFPFLRDRSARWLDSRLRGLRFSLCVRRRGWLNPRKSQGEFLLVGGGPLDFALVVFLVLPRSQCQLAGLASPRDFVLVVAIFIFDGLQS